MMSILRTPLSIPLPPQSLSSLRTISGQGQAEFLTTRFSNVSLTTPSSPFRTTTIRMGGGPRTYPGGVSKWQWKRMQAKKAKQLLKARLARERQIYEMRKRAELKAAISELERPWEVVDKAPTLFSVDADEQLKVLADRFQKPGGFDMWSERDGPELFKPHNELPSARFFPKGVVHSIRPYEKIEKFKDGSPESENFGSGIEGKGDRERGVQGHPSDEKYGKVPHKINVEGNLNSFSEKDSMDSLREGNGGKFMKSNIRKNNYKKRHTRDSAEVGLRNARRDIRPNDTVKGNRHTRDPAEVGLHNARRDLRPNNTVKANRRFNGTGKARSSNSAVYDLDLQEDGSYGFQADNRQ